MEKDFKELMDGYGFLRDSLLTSIIQSVHALGEGRHTHYHELEGAENTILVANFSCTIDKINVQKMTWEQEGIDECFAESFELIDVCLVTEDKHFQMPVEMRNELENEIYKAIR